MFLRATELLKGQDGLKGNTSKENKTSVHDVGGNQKQSSQVRTSNKTNTFPNDSHFTVGPYIGHLPLLVHHSLTGKLMYQRKSQMQKELPLGDIVCGICNCVQLNMYSFDINFAHPC